MDIKVKCPKCDCIFEIEIDSEGIVADIRKINEGHL